jgi:hypothetical protein
MNESETPMTLDDVAKAMGVPREEASRVILSIAELFDPPGADTHTAPPAPVTSTKPAVTGSDDSRGDSR